MQNKDTRYIKRIASYYITVIRTILLTEIKFLLSAISQIHFFPAGTELHGILMVQQKSLEKGPLPVVILLQQH